MRRGKPTLTAMTVRRYLLAALLTLGVLLLCTLALTDTVMLQARSHALYEQLNAVDATDDITLLLCDIGGAAHVHAGIGLLDTDGHWLAQSMTTASPGSIAPGGRGWQAAARVIKAGGLYGTGRVPWVTEPVVWAARTVATAGARPQILVAWERVSAIRAASTPFYIAVIAATLLAFAVSVALALHTVKNVREVLDDIAKSSGQMAAGDFQVQLAPQPTAELDRVTEAINQLAHNLNQTAMRLRQERERLERLEGMQRQFVADASHELRAPLASMRVTLEAWQDGVLRRDEQPAALANVITEIERLGAMVARLLNISRIEAGRETYVCTPVAVADFVAEIIGRYADAHNAPITSDIPPDLPPVCADRDALTSVLCNLLENALRFTEPSGSVRIWAQADGDVLRLGVTDTGCGITSDFLPRIWDRFSRSPEARAGGKAGSGLGLAIVKALTTAMSGQVGAESTPGAGTAVWVCLPIALP